MRREKEQIRTHPPPRLQHGFPSSHDGLPRAIAVASLQTCRSSANVSSGELCAGSRNVVPGSHVDSVNEPRSEADSRVCQNKTEHFRPLAADESRGFLPERPHSQLYPASLLPPVNGRAHCPGQICAHFRCRGPPPSITMLKLISCCSGQGLLGFL